MSAFLYCIRYEELGLAKVGITGHPESRLPGLRSSTPYKIAYSHLLEVESQEVASAWERYILRFADRDSEAGEWVIANPHLDALFEEVTPAVSALDEYTQEFTGRSIPERSSAECFESIYAAQMKARFGPVVAARTPKASTPTQHARNIVNARLDEGYGAQDVLVMDGIPEATYWAVVNENRKRSTTKRFLA